MGKINKIINTTLNKATSLIADVEHWAMGKFLDHYGFYKASAILKYNDFTGGYFLLEALNSHPRRKELMIALVSMVIRSDTAYPGSELLNFVIGRGSDKILMLYLNEVLIRSTNENYVAVVESTPKSEKALVFYHKSDMNTIIYSSSFSGNYPENFKWLIQIGFFLYGFFDLIADKELLIGSLSEMDKHNYDFFNYQYPDEMAEAIGVILDDNGRTIDGERNLHEQYSYLVMNCFNLTSKEERESINRLFETNAEIYGYDLTSIEKTNIVNINSVNKH